MERLLGSVLVALRSRFNLNVKSIAILSTMLIIMQPLLYLGQNIPADSQGHCSKASIPMSNIKANGNIEGHEAQNTNDNNLDSTIWSNEIRPEEAASIRFDLGFPQTICWIEIAWHRGDSREYEFGVHLSTDWPNLEPVFGGNSSGTTSSFEDYNFPDRVGRIVRLAVYGNTENNLGEISEVAIYIAMPILKDTNLQAQSFVKGLDSPTSMAFIGPNDILVLEKNTGMVKRIKDGSVLSPPLLDVNVANHSERGLLGIDVVKITSLHHYVFLYYTMSRDEDGGPAFDNRLVRYVFTNNPNASSAQGTMTAPKLLISLPATPGPNHNGGKVLIGPDKNVYTVIGDVNKGFVDMGTQVQNTEPANRTDILPDGSGGILRITQDGLAVGSGIIGNTNPLNKYYAYGIRNSFGIDFDPITGKLWDSENGVDTNDELNLVDPGFNSGWQDLMGVAPPGFNYSNLINFGGKGKYSDPEFTWSKSIGVTGLEFLASDKLGSEYLNDMFVAEDTGNIYDFDLNTQRDGLLLGGLLSDKIDNTNNETQSVLFGSGFGLITDLKVGPADGYLYVLTLTGTIYRILPI